MKCLLPIPKYVLSLLFFSLFCADEVERFYVTRRILHGYTKHASGLFTFHTGKQARTLSIIGWTGFQIRVAN